MNRQMLSQNLMPELKRFELNGEALAMLEAAREELAARAKLEQDGCWGYFGLDPNLPASQQFAHQDPKFNAEAPIGRFSWLRFSYGRPVHEPNYHLDANGGNGLVSGDEFTATDGLGSLRLIWRTLVNLHDSAERQFAFVNVAPQSLSLEVRNGQIGLSESEEIDMFEEQLLVLPPRERKVVWGAEVCVSRVLHAGLETPKGHFLGSWSRGEAA